MPLQDHPYRKPPAPARKSLVVIECGFKHVSLDGQEARLLGHLLDRDAGEIIDGLAQLMVVLLGTSLLLLGFNPQLIGANALQLLAVHAAVVLFSASAIRMVAIDEATVANTSTATEATAAALCRRVQREALLHADGGRARIGSSLRNRRRSSAIAPAEKYRSPGSLAVALRIIVSSSGGIVLSSDRSGRGSSDSICRSSSSRV